MNPKRDHYRWKLYLLIFAAFICIFGLLALPVGTGPAEEENGMAAQNGQTGRLTWYLDSQVVSLKGGWENYGTLREVSSRTGVLPEVSIPLKNRTEKLDLMIASDNFPDMITLDMDDPYIYKLVRMKKLAPLDRLIQQYEPEFKKEIDTELWKDSVFDDGLLYGLPGNYIPKELYQKKEGMGLYTYNVKKDLYQKLGSPEMDTPDRYMAALRKFKQAFPERNGLPSIPVSLFGMGEDQLVLLERSFGIREYDQDKYHNLLIKYKNPAYLELVKFLNRLYREQLLAPLAFIKKEEQVRDDLEQGRVFSIPANYETLEPINAILEEKQEGTGYIAVEPLKAAAEVSFPGRNRYGATLTMVPAASKKQEETVKFMRYLWGEEANALLDSARADGESFSLPVFAFPYTDAAYKSGATGDESVTRRLADKYVDGNLSFFKGMNPDYGLPIGRVKSKLEDIIRRDFPMSVMAESEDKSVALFKSMLLKLEQTGLEKLEFFWTERYKLNHPVY